MHGVADGGQFLFRCLCIRVFIRRSPMAMQGHDQAADRCANDASLFFMHQFVLEFAVPRHFLKLVPLRILPSVVPSRSRESALLCAPPSWRPR